MINLAEQSSATRSGARVMCRCDIAPVVQASLAEVLDTIATTLAEQTGTPRDQVLIGPVDFGHEETR